MIEIKYITTELFLTLSIFSLLMVGVFLKESFNIVYRLTNVVIVILILLVISSDFENIKLFNNSLSIDSFSKYMKSLILISSFFILAISKKYLVDINTQSLFFYLF